jgi:integrase
MARIRKHRSKWQVLYRDPSTGRERSAGVYTRKSDATKQRRAVEYQLQAGEWIDPMLQATVYEEWAQTWIDTKTHLKPKTLEGYESLFKSRILPYFGSARLRDIRAIQVEQWISAMHNEGLSASRIHQAHSLMSSTLGAAVRSQMIQTNPAEGVSLPRRTRNPMLFLSPAEVERLANEIPEEHQTLVWTLAYTGIREGEATALRRNRVNPLLRKLVIAESATDVHGRKVFTSTKNHETRTVALPNFLCDMLSDHLNTSVPPESDALVFTSTVGTPIDWSGFRRRVWKPAVLRADLDPALRIHDLRHTAASILIAQDCQAKVVQEHLGHKSIMITMDRYGHLYPEDRSKVSDALDAAFAHSDGATA